jgi:hypothetical protein
MTDPVQKLEEYFESLHYLWELKTPPTMTDKEWHQRVNGMYSAVSNCLLILQGKVNPDAFHKSPKQGG